jgi:penicillin-binding protein 1A
MVDAGVITRAEADAAKLEPIEVRPPWRREYRESFAMDAIRRDLEIILEKQDIELGGLEIITTIDLRIQQKAEEALEKKLTRGRAAIRLRPPHPRRLAQAARRSPQGAPYIQGAAVVVENRTGAVLAIVGGRDANESRFNRAKDAKRQLGSIFKPFVYLAAFDKGLRPDSPISDGPIQPGEIKGGGTWRPRNSDGKYGGMHARLLRPDPLAQHDVGARRQPRRHSTRRRSRRDGRVHHARCRKTRPPSSAHGRPPPGKWPPPTRFSPTTASATGPI